jgi:hypothetical protein
MVNQNLSRNAIGNWRNIGVTLKTTVTASKREIAC